MCYITFVYVVFDTFLFVAAIGYGESLFALALDLLIVTQDEIVLLNIFVMVAV